MKKNNFKVNSFLKNTYNRIYETYSKANGGGRISIGR